MTYFRITRLSLSCLILTIAMQLTAASGAQAQQVYFIDGYHGGVWGHYPDWNTRFMVDQLLSNPDWKINIEIEPETWPRVEQVDPEALAQFQQLFSDQSTTGRIEVVNPTYGQPFMYNISGESIIRQFRHGIDLTRKYFPNAVFTSYSSEEPCFTSALPQILKSYGYQYASLKNPNTCWGGYTRAFGGELVNWIGSDGTSITTVPRYEIEALEPNSTWQTIAWNNSETYLRAAFDYGIANPVGMCLQDAGWKGGPWLGKGDKTLFPSIYKTWRDYIENTSIKHTTTDWNFTQDDLLVSLVWGSQIMQKLAQQNRYAEQRIIVAEKMATLAQLHQPSAWPSLELDTAWTRLLLAQHHDCWIVPYNGGDNSWAHKVERWTNQTNSKSDSIIHLSLQDLGGATQSVGENNWVRVYNTQASPRSEVATLSVPTLLDASVGLIDEAGNDIPVQLLTGARDGSSQLLFHATVPAFGYNTYRLARRPASAPATGVEIQQQVGGTWLIESNLYRITIDPAKGGTITSLVGKAMDNREFVDQSHARMFNEMRGNFYNDGGFLSSADSEARIEVIEKGPLRVKVAVHGHIGTHPFTQLLTVDQGNPRIDLGVTIDWQGNPGIGNDYAQDTKWVQEDVRKAFYDDREKLLVLFPLNLESQRVYKNAPFDVMESPLENTFFTTWDSIKNNIILDWVDVTDENNTYGMALYSDHTTSYAHGQHHPLGLTMQYSGMGLWGRNYRITGPTEVTYSIVPHQGKWDEAGLWTIGNTLKEPLLVDVMNANSEGKWSQSMISITGKGMELASTVMEGDDLLLRIFNAEGYQDAAEITVSRAVDSAELVELDGRISAELPVRKTDGGAVVDLSIPQYGFRTIRLSGLW